MAATTKVSQALAPKSPFMWGAKGEMLTPEQVESSRRFSDSLRAPQGYTPKGWASLLGSLAGEGVASYKEGEADKAETAGEKTVADALALKDYQGAMSNPWATDQQMSVADSLQGRDWQQQDQAANWAREDARAASAWNRGAEERALDAEYKRAQIGALNAKPGQPLINAGGGSIYDPNTDSWKSDPNGGPANVDFGDIAGVRKEVQGLPSYKNLAQALPIYNSMSETAGRDSRASDLNLVYGLGKIMDPTSVVREGEMFMVQGINTLPDKLIEGINSVLTGSSTLSPATRESILKEAYGRMKGYEGAFASDTSTYTDLAGRYKINPQDILPEFKPSSPWAPQQPPPAQPAAAGEVPSITDDAGYDALPSGAVFIGPDGQTRKKP